MPCVCVVLKIRWDERERSGDLSSSSGMQRERERRKGERESERKILEKIGANMRNVVACSTHTYKHARTHAYAHTHSVVSFRDNLLNH